MKKQIYNLAILKCIDLEDIVEWHDNVTVEHNHSMICACDAKKVAANEEDPYVAIMDRVIDTSFRHFGIVIEGLISRTNRRANGKKATKPWEYERWVLTQMTRKQFEGDWHD